MTAILELPESTAASRRQRIAADSIFIMAVRLMAAVAAGGLYLALISGVISNAVCLAACTVLLTAYLGIELRNQWRRDRDRFWINPVVLASFVTFLLHFSFSNALQYFPPELTAQLGISSDITIWMNKLMLLVILGACSMWLGYDLSLGRGAGRILRNSRELKKWLRPSAVLRMPTLYLFIAISFLARMAAIKAGVFGYSATKESQLAFAPYQEYLNIAEMLGKMALLGAALQAFSPNRPSVAARKLLWLVCGYEMFFGLLSGMKGNVVMPLVIVGVAYYGRRNKLPTFLIPLVAVAIIAAYALIEPFRRVAHSDVGGLSATSVSGIASTMMNRENADEFAADNPTPLWLNLLARTNLLAPASLGLQYAAINSPQKGDPAFLNNILLAPAYAVVPRIIWKKKPLDNIGGWYTHQVMGMDFESATAMSPFTYLNFAGGTLAVIIGFLLAGALQRSAFEALRTFGDGGLIVFLGLLMPLINIDSAYYTLFTFLVRYVPIMIVTQRLLLKPSTQQ